MPRKVHHSEGHRPASVGHKCMCVCIRAAYTDGVYKSTIFSKGSLSFFVYARHVCMGCMRKVPLKKVVDLHAHWVYLQCMQKYVEPVQEPVLSTDSN